MSLFNKRNLRLAAIVVAIPALALAWWLGSPLFLDNEVDEAFPIAAEDQPADTTEDPTEQEIAEPAPEPDVDSEDTMPETGPTVLAAGTFRDADDFHLGTGEATIYRLEDGSSVLRFEDFEVTNGPDLHVYLVPADNSGEDVDITGYVDLGELKGNIGDQNYEIPDDVDITGYGSVVIWCEPFAVLFSVATLES